MNSTPIQSPFRASLVALLTATALGCSDGAGVSSPGESPPTAAELAEAQLFESMNQDAIDQVSAVIDQLEAVSEDEPDNSRITFLLGGAHLWNVAEGERTGSDIEDINMTSGVGAYLNFKKAYEADPDDPIHVGFMGAFLYDSGFNHEMGLALADQSAEMMPEFGHFVRALIRRDAAPNDPLTAEAIDALWQLFDACLGEPLDRGAPDYGPHMDKPRGDSLRDRLCWGSERVPHGLEGVFLYMGDLLVKYGNTQLARTFYQNAQLQPRYAAWPHRAVIEERLAADLEARHADYADPDPDGWPALMAPPYACTVCHATSQ